MRKPTYAQLAARLGHIERENYSSFAAIRYLMAGQFQLVGRKSYYTVRLAGALAPDGGTVLVTFAYPGQLPSHCCETLETWAHACAHRFSDNEETAALRELATKALAMARAQQRAAFDAEQAAKAVDLAIANIA